MENNLKYTYDDIVYCSELIRQVLRLLDKITDSKIPVVICGESGTGKELVAKALHYNSGRKMCPFVSENCAAISGNLLESELFGHSKGAFTGADRDKDGLFKYANGGTLFLDEIGDMPMELQSKLLRVVQEGEMRPIGSTKTFKVDVRIVCATHHDLSLLVRERKFRADLYYRLNGMTVFMPSLRERKEDIPLLVRHFLDKFGYQNIHVDPEVFELFSNYTWPGNIRELEHVVHNACLFSDVEKITPETVCFKRELFLPEGMVLSQESRVALQDEPTRLRQALRLAKMNKTEAARLLGISRSTLYAKLALYQIDNF